MKPTLLLSLALLSPMASAQQYSLKQSHTGSNIPRTVLDAGDIPLNKRYADLSTEQKALVRAEYAGLEPDDEPPFPLYGLGSLYRNVYKVYEILDEPGVVSMIVKIDPKGEATGVEVLDSPSKAASKFIAGVLILEKYKPALCKGVPCAMDFPFKIALKRTL